MVKVLVIILLVSLLLFSLNSAISVSNDSGKEIIDNAVKSSLITYYAVNGIYPDKYETLKEFSNLSINEEKYHIFYNAIASNLLPEVDVISIE